METLAWDRLVMPSNGIGCLFNEYCTVQYSIVSCLDVPQRENGGVEFKKNRDCKDLHPTFPLLQERGSERLEQS